MVDGAEAVHTQAEDLNEEPGQEEDREPVPETDSSVLSPPPTPLTPKAEPAANLGLDKSSRVCLYAQPRIRLCCSPTCWWTSCHQCCPGWFDHQPDWTSGAACPRETILTVRRRDVKRKNFFNWFTKTLSYFCLSEDWDCSLITSCHYSGGTGRESSCLPIGITLAMARKMRLFCRVPVHQVCTRQK